MLAPKRRDMNQPLVTMTQWSSHYRELLGHEEDLQLPAIEGEGAGTWEITNEEVERAVRKMKKGKAVGPDRVAIEVLKNNHQLIPLITRAMNMAITNKELLMTWRQSYLRPIYKSGDPTVPGNYRGISFMAHLLKMFTWAVAEKLREDHEHQIHPNQYGFMRGKSCEKAVVKLMEYVETKKGKCYGLFVDFAKAFDKVPRTKLLQKLREDFNVDPNMLAIIRAVLQPMEIVVNDGVYIQQRED